MQHLRALRVAKKLKREALAKEEEEEEYLPKELVARMDMSEEEPEKEKDSDLDSSEDSEDEVDCEITDSEEQEPVQANTSALDILTTKKHGAFDSTTFVYQRRPEPSERTLFRKSQEKREHRKAAENTPTLIEAL